MIELNDFKSILDFFSPLKNKYHISAGIILGSGLGNFADELEEVEGFFTKDIKGYPVSTVAGHKGRISICKFHNRYFLLFNGRVHLYEGYPIRHITLNAVINHFFDSKFLIVTNAAGGINPSFKPGSLMLIDDLLFVLNKNRFVELINRNQRIILDKELNSKIIELGAKNNLELVRGVYSYLTGPSYETPAEIRFLRYSGADAIGMSTVPEIIYSLQNGIKVVGISCISNLAAGISDKKLSHAEVTETANMVRDKFTGLLKLIMRSDLY